MHDGMPFDPIQGQGHGASEVSKITLFQLSLLHIYNGSWQMTTDVKREHNM